MVRYSPYCCINCTPVHNYHNAALVDNEDIKASNLASYSDGSVENDLPMQQLSELFNVNHFIVSQVLFHSLRHS
jgi:predicted acylesterase/phospholipase RssA